MCSIAEQGDAPVRPARQRVAVAHRVFPGRAALGYQRRHVEPIPPPAGKGLCKHRLVDLPGPILFGRRFARRGRHRQLHDPVGEVVAGLVEQLFRDRVNHRLLGGMTGLHHAAPGEKRRRHAGAAPEHAAGVFWRAFIGVESRTHRRVHAVGGDNQVGLHLGDLLAGAPVLEHRRGARAADGATM